LTTWVVDRLEVGNDVMHFETFLEITALGLAPHVRVFPAGELRLSAGGGLGTNSQLVVEGILTLNSALSGTTATTFVQPSGTLTGSGSIAGNVIVAGGTVAPGSSAGALEVGDTVQFNANSTLEWDIADWLGAPGVGYDQLRVDTAQFSGGFFNVVIKAPPQGIANFDGSPRSFTVLTASSAITGFVPGNVTGNVTSAGSASAGQWSITQHGLDLVLSYSGDPYLHWADTSGIPEAQWAFTFDAENDGVSNGMEFVLATNPMAPTHSDDLPKYELVTHNNSPHVRVTHRLHAVAAYLQPFVEFGATVDLPQRAVDGVNGVNIFSTPNHYAIGIHRVETLIPYDGTSPIYVRFRVVR